MFMNPKFVVKVGYLLLLAFGAFHFSKFMMTVATSLLLARFGKPSLVRETSKIYTNNYLMIPYMYGRKLASSTFKKTEKSLLEGVILEKNLEDQLREISYAVLNRKKHFAPCKNLMFFGPPGTGKTLFAKKLAT
jgi:ATPase family AAA domain-containing protein 3A/B